MARPSIWTHRKFTRLCRLLNSKPLAIGSLEILWAAAYVEGEASLGSGADVEHLAGWNGEPGSLASALVEAGFLDDENGTLMVHDLEENAPEYVKAKIRKRRQRAKSSVSHVTVTGRDRDSHAIPFPALPSSSSEPSVPQKSGGTSSSPLHPPNADQKRRRAPRALRNGKYDAAFLRCKDYAFKTWAKEHGHDPAWLGIHYKALHSSVSALKGDVDEFEERWSAFLDAREDWLRDHDPKVFVSKLERWALEEQ